MSISSAQYTANFQITFVYCKNKFSDFITLLQKGVMCYEYINSCNKFNEKSLPSYKEKMQYIKD